MFIWSSIASLILSLPALPTASATLCLSHSNNFEHLVSIEFFKASWGYYFLMILLGEQQASFLQPFTIEVVCIFEYLTNWINIYMLCKNVFTLSFDWLNIISITKLKKFEDVFAFDFDVVRIYVFKEFIELIIWYSTVIEVNHSHFFLWKVMCKQRLEVSWTGGQNDLVCIYLLSFNTECDVAEVFLIK